MSILFDTNILIHAANAASPLHVQAKRLRHQAVEGLIDACLTPQVLWEFYTVMTNPSRVTHPLTPHEAIQEVQAYLNADRLTIIMPQRTTVQRTAELLRRAGVTGRRVFDVYLAATMLEHNVRVIYTQNTKDFTAFREIQAINPFAAIPA